MITRFFLYGALGWCMEVIWTGLHSLLKKDYKLTSSTSIWMFFIYGLAIFLEPMIEMLKVLPFYVRGGVYVVCIFAVEYITGGLLKKVNSCPWDYSNSRFHVKGLIRLDYAPAWFVAGLIFEGVYHYMMK